MAIPLCRIRGSASAALAEDFPTALIEWEIKVAAYEVASRDRICEPARMATILDHASDDALPSAFGPEMQCECCQELDS